MTRLRLGLSLKFSHNFQNCINLLCFCGMDIESTSHFFLYWTLFNEKRITLMSTLSNIDCKLIEMNESSLTETLLFGNSLFDLKKIPCPKRIHRLHFIYWKIRRTFTLTCFRNYH